MTHKLFSGVRKNALVLIALLGLGALSLFSCSKKSGTSSPYTISGTATSGSTTTPISVSGQSFVFAQVVNTGSGNVLELTGESFGGGDTTGFSFVIYNYTGAGTYNLTDTGTSFNEGVYINRTATTAIDDIAASGSLVVSSVSSTQITGTFTFTGALGTHISNGTYTAILLP